VLGSIPTVVRAFKSAATKRINALRGTPGVLVWQRNYWDHIIRTERALDAIRRYIVNNPARVGPDPLAADVWQMMRNCPPGRGTAPPCPYH